MAGIKSIGILTSGGDAPGMNAAIRAVTRSAIYNGFTVKGIMRGFKGLVFNEIVEFKSQSVSNIIQLGGTILKTARSEEFKTVEGRKAAYDNMVAAGIDALVVIGGDGSLTGAGLFAEEYNVPIVGLPGTIDNDIACTDYTIGYDTAMNTAVEMIDKLRDTTQSHDRCSVVEVMGRKAGFIAVNVAIAVGAEAVITLERPYDLDAIAAKMVKTKNEKGGKHHFIIVVAEGVGQTENISRTLQEMTGIESRVTVLGHVQRGGSPTLRDRVIATEMGYHAVELLEQGIGNRIVGLKDGKVYDIDLQEGLAMKKPFIDQRYDIFYDTAY